MAKLNKSDAMQAAKKIAAGVKEVNDMTIEQINELDYKGRRELAESLVNLHCGHSVIDTHTQYRAAAEEAFVDGCMDVWSRKLKNLDNLRRNWKRAIDGVTLEDATTKIVELVKSMNIRGARVDSHSVEVTRDGSNWGGPRLSWSFDRDYDRKTVNPDDDSQCAHKYDIKLGISTGGTTYTLAQMAMLTKIQAELLDAANELTVVVAGWNVISTWGIDKA